MLIEPLGNIPISFGGKFFDWAKQYELSSVEFSEKSVIKYIHMFSRIKH